MGKDWHIRKMSVKYGEVRISKRPPDIIHKPDFAPASQQYSVFFPLEAFTETTTAILLSMYKAFTKNASISP